MKRLKWQNWAALQLSAGMLMILLFGPGLLFTFVSGLQDRLLGGDALARLGWGPFYRVTFGVLFATGLVSLFAGLRELTRPPSLLYRLTHPRLPRWVRRRSVRPLP